MGKKNLRGFTLIELLVVVAIIGILSALILANFNSARERTRDAQRKSDLDQIKKALLLYYHDQSPTRYPSSSSLVFGSAFTSGGIIYMKMVPNDPLSPTQSYLYRPVSGSVPQDFCLRAVLENGADPDGPRSQVKCATACTNAGVTLGGSDYAACAD